jgi:signal transduction histidine kinase
MTALGALRSLRSGVRQGDAGSAATPRAEVGEAGERILRVLYLAVALGGLVYSGVGLDKTMSQFPSLPGWFAWGGWLVSTGSPVILGILAFWAPLRLLRWVASLYGVLFFGVMLAWPPLQITPGLVGQNSPWTNDVLTVATLAVAVSWRPRWTWAYVVVSAAGSGYVRYLSDPPVGLHIALLDTSYNLLMNSVFASLVIVTRQGASRQDDAAATARRETSREAEASARFQQRVRIDALVHDHVLSALLIASRDDPVSRNALRALAASTLETLSTESPLGAEPLTEEDFVSRLRSSVTSQSDGILFVTDLAGTLMLPADIAQALLEATAEAVRNTLRHALPRDGATEVLRSVSVTTHGGAVEITVRDDGRGFNSRRIPPERLGVRVSILSRMKSLADGYATVDSTRGTGTTVTIGWRGETREPRGEQL